MRVVLALLCARHIAAFALCAPAMRVAPRYGWSTSRKPAALAGGVFMYEIYNEREAQREGEPSPSLSEKLAEMEKTNTQRGLTVLGSLLAVILWLFTVPPDIRRTEVCPPGSAYATQSCVSLSALGERVATHYATCGRGEGAAALSVQTPQT